MNLEPDEIEIDRIPPTLEEKVDAIYEFIAELKPLLEEAKPLLESAGPMLESMFGGTGKPASPMSMIMGSLMGGRN